MTTNQTPPNHCPGIAYCESHEPTGADRADGYAPAGSACWSCGATDADNVPLYVTEGN